ADAPSLLALPTDRARPARPSYRGAAVSATLSPELTRSLLDLGREEGATPFMTLLAVLDVVLARLADQADVVVGTPIANRNRTETEGLIGFILNNLALRVNVPGGVGFRALLRQVRDVCLASYAHQSVPFEMVLDALKIERSLSRAPLFQVFFNMLTFE